MAKTDDITRPKARIARGFRDGAAGDVRARLVLLERIRAVYELYGFAPLDTPALEYADALGKFLPDQDRPNEGVFSFQDEDEQWLALRYDLTAPLARFVAENFDALPKPFRRYQMGPVWRNEKAGPGRYREFIQFDADTVGSASMAADAELCMMVAEALEALGLKRGEYLIKVNNRKVLDGVLESVGISPGDTRKHLTILRAIDKFDRLGAEGVRFLLGKGRKDESGDFTKGAELEPKQTDRIVNYVALQIYGDDFHLQDWRAPIETWRRYIGESEIGVEGLSELQKMAELFASAGFGPDRILFDSSVVRGLEYYTGPVFEAVLTFPVTNDKGEVVQFGSVAGGGRYDGLVGRFKGIEVPATGISIGVDRLLAGLSARKAQSAPAFDGPVVVLMLDQAEIAGYQRLVQELRGAGIAAELYLGGSGMKAQMKYADKRGAPIAVIEGGDERAKGEVTLKDLALGAKLSQEISSQEEWRKGQPAQISVKRAKLVDAVQELLSRRGAR
jgi:histidyl-tRNA synthetase